MRTARAKMIVGCLQRAASPDAGLTDGLLLARYVSRRDSVAFESLVRRHGPMVLAVCRRVLRHAQDAEDAFQATFLVLARKAASVAKRESVGAWLHGVAYRAALQAQASRRRRRAKELQVEDMPHPIVLPEDNDGELLALLDRELARLPEKHRAALVLCELEGRSRKEAARQLGLAEGTLSSRLARGRQMLARRMAAHGAAVAVGSLAALFAGGARAACVPCLLVVSTVRAAGGAVPAGVAALAKGVMKAMLWSNLKCGAGALLVAAVIGVGATIGVLRMAAAAESPRPPIDCTAATPVNPGAARPDAPNRDDLESLRLEVEALRLELKATKARVKALEDQAQKTPPEPGTAPFPLLVTGMPGVGFTPGPPGILPNNPGSTPGLPAGVQPPSPGFQPKAAPPAPPDLDAALKALKQNPDDKQALDALLRALHQQKEKAPETPLGRPSN